MFNKKIITAEKQPCQVTNHYYINFGDTTISVDSHNITNKDGSTLRLSSGQGTKEDKKHSSVWKWIMKGLILAATLLLKMFGNIPIPPLRC